MEARRDSESVAHRQIYRDAGGLAHYHARRPEDRRNSRLTKYFRSANSITRPAARRAFSFNATAVPYPRGRGRPGAGEPGRRRESAWPGFPAPLSEISRMLTSVSAAAPAAATLP